MIDIDAILRQPCNETDVAALRQKIIEKGRHHYTDKKQEIRAARVIAKEDAVFLYKLTSLIMPKTVLEIGTWFGTSAEIMNNACGCDVYTCDRNNVYELENDKIHFYNIQSDVFLGKMLDMKIAPEMCFVDAKLRDNDASIIVEIMRGGVFVVHDYVAGEKGYKNVKRIKAELGSGLNILSYNGVAIFECYGR